MSEMCGHPLDKENEKRNGCEYRMKIIVSFGNYIFTKRGQEKVEIII